METKYAEKAIITLSKGNEKYFIKFDNSREGVEKIVGFDLLPDEDIDKIMDFYNHWDKRTTGLFISKNNVLCFVLIFESVLNDYKIEYKWIDGADPYKAWKDEQRDMPLNTVY